MTPVEIVFVAVYGVLLCAYFYTRTSGKNVLRAVNKIAMATMYLVFAYVTFHLHEFEPYYYVLMAALFLAYLGDVFLIFDFVRGGDFFLAGNVCFSVFYLASLSERQVPFASFFWVLIAWAALVAVIAVLFYKLPNVFKLGKMKIGMLMYLASITLHGMLGLACLVYAGGLRYILMGTGSLLFMASDYIITVERFVLPKNKWIYRANSLTYFSGLLLIALSLIF